MDRAVIEALHLLPERQRFMKGLFAWVGFKSTTLKFKRKPREQGKSKLSPFKLTSLALDGMASFSIFHLKFGSTLGELGLLLRVAMQCILFCGYSSMVLSYLVMHLCWSQFFSLEVYSS